MHLNYYVEKVSILMNIWIHLLHSMKQKLPEKEKYYSIIRNEDLTDEEYNFVKEMWETLKIENLGQLYDIYMNTDVMLLQCWKIILFFMFFTIIAQGD